MDRLNPLSCELSALLLSGLVSWRNPSPLISGAFQCPLGNAWRLTPCSGRCPSRSGCATLTFTLIITCDSSAPKHQQGSPHCDRNWSFSYNLVLLSDGPGWCSHGPCL